MSTHTHTQNANDCSAAYVVVCLVSRKVLKCRLFEVIVRPPYESYPGHFQAERLPTANLRTKILDFGGFYASRIFILRGGILMSKGNTPDVLSQRILAGIINISRETGRKRSGKQ